MRSLELRTNFSQRGADYFLFWLQACCKKWEQKTLPWNVLIQQAMWALLKGRLTPKVDRYKRNLLSRLMGPPPFVFCQSYSGSKTESSSGNKWNWASTRPARDFCLNSLSKDDWQDQNGFGTKRFSGTILKYLSQMLEQPTQRSIYLYFW